MNDPYERSTETDSEDTVELPERFDEHGNRKPEAGGNELATRFGELFGSGGGRGGSVGRGHGGGDDERGDVLGEMLKGLAGNLFHGQDQGRRRRR